MPIFRQIQPNRLNDNHLANPLKTRKFSTKSFLAQNFWIMEGLNGHFVNIFLKTRPGRFVPILNILVSTANILFTLIKSCRAFSLNDVPNYAFFIGLRHFFCPSLLLIRFFLVYLQRVYRWVHSENPSPQNNTPKTMRSRSPPLEGRGRAAPSFTTMLFFGVDS